MALIKVYILENDSDARLVKGFLESGGIECVINPLSHSYPLKGAGTAGLLDGLNVKEEDAWKQKER